MPDDYVVVGGGTFAFLVRRGLRSLDDVALASIEDLADTVEGESVVAEIEGLFFKWGLDVKTTDRDVRTLRSQGRQVLLPNSTFSGMRVDERVHVMAGMQLQGDTLERIGRAFGITRERARQILAAAGYRFRPSEVRLSKERAELDAAKASLIAGFRAGEDVAELAERHALPVGSVRGLFREAAEARDYSERAAARGRHRKSVERRYTDSDITEGIRWLAEHLGRTPASNEYTSLAREHGLASLPTVSNRFGSWRSAVTSAGLQTAGGGPGNTHRRWTEAACWDALEHLVEGMGVPPTVQQYELLAGLDEKLPSLPTVRNRLGRWSQMTIHLIDLPTPRDVLDRLGLVIDPTTDQSSDIYVAFLADEVDVRDLRSLRRAGLFDWDSSFGEPPAGYPLPSKSGDR